MGELNCESCLDAQNIKQGKADDFSLILQPIAQLLMRKNADYGDSFKLLREKYGPVGFYIRVADKLNRIEQVDKNGNQVNESAIDTLKDIIGYCTLEIRYRQSLLKDEKFTCNDCKHGNKGTKEEPCVKCKHCDMNYTASYYEPADDSQ